MTRRIRSREWSLLEHLALVLVLAAGATLVAVVVAQVIGDLTLLELAPTRWLPEAARA
jgi:hypothetical protein